MSTVDLFGLGIKTPDAKASPNGIYRRSTFAAAAGADGTALATLGPVPAGATWIVQRITVNCTTTANSSATVYVGGDLASASLVDGTTDNFDINEANPPVVVLEGESLFVQWTDAHQGDACEAIIQWVAPA